MVADHEGQDGEEETVDKQEAKEREEVNIFQIFSHNHALGRDNT